MLTGGPGLTGAWQASWCAGRCRRRVNAVSEQTMAAATMPSESGGGPVERSSLDNGGEKRRIFVDGMDLMESSFEGTTRNGRL